MRIVLALGGNALLRRGEEPSVSNQRRNVERAAAAMRPLCLADNEIVITHGNGPQVGLLTVQSDAGPVAGRYPLDVIGAETEGMLGYLIEQELRNALPSSKQVASLLTQVVVDASDPSFGRPTKPIGAMLSADEARHLAGQDNVTIMRDGDGWRRAVASPRPQRILVQPIIDLLLSSGVVVICVGGGGIPVVCSADGRLSGVEAVVDKDAASALLARELGADALLLLTDVDAVYLNWMQHGQKAIAAAGVDALDASRFAEGSMRPKVEAAIEFVRASGKPAAIGRLDDIEGILERRSGTTIDPDQAALVLRGG